jgi:HPt (histidine-containing phosphotransfer) domain-containing protein
MNKILVTVESDLQDLIPDYLENRVKDLSAIEDCLGKGDYDAIRRMAHRMKGSGGGYGFDGITAIGAAMEQAAVANDSGEIKRQAQALKDYLDRVEITYV